MFRPLHAYYSPSPAEWCDISQRGLLAVGYGRRIQVGRPILFLLLTGMPRIAK